MFGHGPMFTDRTGKPIDMRTYARLMQDPDYRRVGSTDVGPYWVSTVWLGVAMPTWLGPPLIFETAVFARSERDEPDPVRPGLRDFDMVRWATEQEALDGHDAMVTLIRATTVDNVTDITEERARRRHH